MEDHRFSGDTSRNEVELDLTKFMSMIEEINQLKEKISSEILKMKLLVILTKNGFI